MNFGSLIKQITNNKVITRQRTNVNKLETSKGVFYNRDNLYGEDSAEFYISLINLFDRAIINGNLHLLSVEQERLLSSYLEQGNTLTRQHTSAENQSYISKDDEFLHNIWVENDDEIILDLDFQNSYNNQEYNCLFKAMDRTIQKLDDFLGSYIGEENGRYSRYGKKQFHCKRESVGQTIKTFIRT